MLTITTGVWGPKRNFIVDNFGHLLNEQTLVSGFKIIEEHAYPIITTLWHKICVYKLSPSAKRIENVPM
jgi:hypothetical protein